MKKNIQKLLFATLAMLAGIAVVETIRAGTFAQRYGANSYIFNHPLYFKKIDNHGLIIREERVKHPRREMKKMENNRRKMKTSKKKLKRVVKQNEMERNTMHMKNNMKKM